MKGRYPRTVSEYAANQRSVWLHCSACQRKRLVPPDVLDALFGPDFDLYAGFAALETELRCESCGKKHRTILFRDDTRYPQYVEVSFEDALNRKLEMRAYWAVRIGGRCRRLRE